MPRGPRRAGRAARASGTATWRRRRSARRRRWRRRRRRRPARRAARGWGAAPWRRPARRRQWRRRRQAGRSKIRIRESNRKAPPLLLVKKIILISFFFFFLFFLRELVRTTGWGDSASEGRGGRRKRTRDGDGWMDGWMEGKRAVVIELGFGCFPA